MSFLRKPNSPKVGMGDLFRGRDWSSDALRLAHCRLQGVLGSPVALLHRCSWQWCLATTKRLAGQDGQIQQVCVSCHEPIGMALVKGLAQ